MRITCPSCAAAYEVPASRLKPRKMVRCERCGEVWAAVQEADAPAAAGPAEPRIEATEPDVAGPTVTAMDRLRASYNPHPSSRNRLLAAWIVTIFLLVGAISATVVWRAEVMRIWPSSARLLGPGHHPPEKPATAPHGAP